jgi:hypothetical protein
MAAKVTWNKVLDEERRATVVARMERSEIRD